MPSATGTKRPLIHEVVQRETPTHHLDICEYFFVEKWTVITIPPLCSHILSRRSRVNPNRVPKRWPPQTPTPDIEGPTSLGSFLTSMTPSLTISLEELPFHYSTSRFQPPRSRPLLQVDMIHRYHAETFATITMSTVSFPLVALSGIDTRNGHHPFEVATYGLLSPSIFTLGIRIAHVSLAFQLPRNTLAELAFVPRWSYESQAPSAEPSSVCSICSMCHDMPFRLICTSPSVGATSPLPLVLYWNSAAQTIRAQDSESTPIPWDHQR